MAPAPRLVTTTMPWGPEHAANPARLLTREWLVTNGLGGYASGAVGGACTRRYHGLLVAALPSPLGRTVMLTHLGESVALADGRELRLTGEERPDGSFDVTETLQEFRLESGLPVWHFRVGGVVLEKRILMPYRQNTVHVAFRMLAGPTPIRLLLRPRLNFRRHEDDVTEPLVPYDLFSRDRRHEVRRQDGAATTLRLMVHGAEAEFILDGGKASEFHYRLEWERGYAHRGPLWSPGRFSLALAAGGQVTLVASTEEWDTIEAFSPADTRQAELERRQRLIEQAHPLARSGVAAELVLAADQFIIAPQGRSARAEDARTVIAGYHWFTDWGRDTMISLEGLTLTTGRSHEAGAILRTFQNYVRDGLIPNMFPEGQNEGLYHTADATLWYFHAMKRYVEVTGDRSTLRHALPTLNSIVEHHLKGTRFGIGADGKDGLLRQGADGYQLTWMDAKVDGWVVTPRRGKAVEINALWFNALRLMEGWMRAEGDDLRAAELGEHAARAQQSFNRRFWNPQTGALFDVVDGEDGDDAAIRPNMLLAISLAHPVLEESRWAAVMDVTLKRLVTPVGLRSLAPGHPDFRPRYDGDLRARDAAYHQGTVWGWLAGPFADAWLKVHPHDAAGLKRVLDGFVPHLGEACLGSISEVFDAEEPFTPRGCVAQAWSVAELLRAWVRCAELLAAAS